MLDLVCSRHISSTKQRFSKMWNRAEKGLIEFEWKRRGGLPFYSIGKHKQRDWMWPKKQLEASAKRERNTCLGLIKEKEKFRQIMGPNKKFICQELGTRLKCVINIGRFSQLCLFKIMLTSCARPPDDFIALFVNQTALRFSERQTVVIINWSWIHLWLAIVETFIRFIIAYKLHTG